MAYVIDQPRPMRRRAVPARRQVPLYPLPSPTRRPLSASPPKTFTQWQGLLIAVLVVVALLVLLYYLDRQAQKTLPRPKSGVKRASTQELAKNLYRRLEDRGGVHPTTMRSLEQLGRRRS